MILSFVLSGVGVLVGFVGLNWCEIDGVGVWIVGQCFVWVVLLMYLLDFGYVVENGCIFVQCEFCNVYDDDCSM